MPSTAVRRHAFELTRLAVGSAIAMTSLATAVAATARWTWPGRMAVEFRWHVGEAALLAALVALAIHWKRRALFLIALGLGSMAAELELWLPASSPPSVIVSPAASPPESATTTVRMASFNLNWDRRDHQDLFDFVDQHRIEVLCLLEISAHARSVLAAEHDRFPYQFVSRPDWQEDAWGLGIFSRHPLRQRKIRSIGHDVFPLLEAEVDLGTAAIALRVVHLISPENLDRLFKRDRSLALLGTDFEWSDQSVIVGDFNLTAGSPLYRDLLDATGLRDSRQGFGRMPTWRPVSWLPGPAFCLDHVLVGRAITVESRAVGDIRASDHDPVAVELTVR